MENGHRSDVTPGQGHPRTANRIHSNFAAMRDYEHAVSFHGFGSSQATEAWRRFQKLRGQAIA